jgi:hypothetical protein
MYAINLGFSRTSRALALCGQYNPFISILHLLPQSVVFCFRSV